HILQLPPTEETVAVDEIGTVKLIAAGDISLNQPLETADSPGQLNGVRDTFQSEGEESLAEESPSDPPRRIRVIGPWHPTLISCDLDSTNVLPYPRRPNALISSCCDTPRTYQGAIKSSKSEKWIESISKELDSMNELEVWDVVDLDPNFRLVGTTGVFKVKKDHLGNITEHKGPLAAQFTPRSNCFCLFKRTRIPSGGYQERLPQRPLAETVYPAIPQGLNLDQRKHWDNPIWLYVHVDDIAIFGKEVSGFKTELANEFEIKDLGQANLLLGIKITHSDDFVSLDQQHFTESLLELYGMSNCKAVSTPLVPGVHLEAATREDVEEFQALNVSYRSAIGCINYLSTATRPDLSHSVSALSQFLDVSL
ncbi:hypothetical protein O181_119380, partial [Austropuccinia psidii MF-1]|nr:hypothetical protein [Austropuccinia psidii MF-1]